MRRLLSTEYLWELRGANAIRKYDQMRFSDPKVAGLRFAQNLPLLRAAVDVEPADPDDKDAVAKADLVRRHLLEDFPWRSFLADTTLCKDYGFSAHEIVWRIEDGEARFRLALRPASSIRTDDIYVTDGRIDHVVQRPQTGGDLTIPGENLIWFCNQKEGDNFAGRSILRPMYKPWKLKEELEVQLAVLIGKLGGVPVFTTHTELDEETEELLEEAGESFGIAAGAYLKIPDDVEAELLASNAKVGEVLEAIKYWDTQLTNVAQAQVLDLGTTSAGNRALGTTLRDMFSDAIQVDASYREDVLNAREGLVHQDVAYNFPNDDNLPKLRFGNVQRADIAALAQALKNLADAGMTFGGETWDFIRSELNLPESDSAQVVVPGQSEGQTTAAGDEKSLQATGKTPDSPEDGGAQASESHTHGDGLLLSERRQPRGVECFVQLAEIEQRFDDAKTAVADATQRDRDRLVGELVSRALTAKAKGQLAKFAASQPPMVDALKASILPVLREFYESGREQVADELERQREGRPVVEEALKARGDGQRITAAEKPKKPAKLPDPDEAIEDAAEMAARSIASRVQVAAAAAAARTGAGIPLDPSSAAEAATREGDAAALHLVGVVSDLMSLGRSVEMEAQAQDVADYVYSAILDGNCCENCEPMDGETTVDADEAATWAPNPNCLGGDRCRCLVIAEIAQEAA